jgi:hypothetical protein
MLPVARTHLQFEFSNTTGLILDACHVLPAPHSSSVCSALPVAAVPKGPEWTTGADHLRHTKFAALRDDKDPRKVVRET